METEGGSMVPMKLMITTEQSEGLRRIKDQSGVPVSEQIRRLLDQWINTNGQDQVATGPDNRNRATIGRTSKQLEDPAL